jgi:hypothetical protein
MIKPSEQSPQEATVFSSGWQKLSWGEAFELCLLTKDQAESTCSTNRNIGIKNLQYFLVMRFLFMFLNKVLIKLGESIKTKNSNQSVC